MEETEHHNMDLIMERSALNQKIIPEGFLDIISDIISLPIDRSLFRDISKLNSSFSFGFSNINIIESYTTEYLEELNAIIVSEIDISRDQKSEIHVKKKYKIFIVHGHDNELKAETSSFLKDFPNLSPIILHEQTSGGKTIIEKLEHYSDVDFAVILMSPDDKMDQGSYRARQNVILELGFYFAKLSRERVVILKRSSLEMPSDLAGIVYINADSAGKWKVDLLKEMKGNGIDVDMNYLK